MRQVGSNPTIRFPVKGDSKRSQWRRIDKIMMGKIIGLQAGRPDVFGGRRFATRVEFIRRTIRLVRAIEERKPRSQKPDSLAKGMGEQMGLSSPNTSGLRGLASR